MHMTEPSFFTENLETCRSAIYRSGFKCVKCNKSYSSKNVYLDLTLIADAKEYVEAQPTRTELFRYEYDVLNCLLI